MIHRDLKPYNVLMSGRHVFLADFGVARAVAARATEDQTRADTGVMLGTPGYMAPEQLTMGPVDHRSDIYAFGVMAYELLTGAPPFSGSRQDIVTAHLTQSFQSSRLLLPTSRKRHGLRMGVLIAERF